MSKVSVRTLGDLCEVVNGSTPNTKDSGFWGGPHQWITPKEMGSLKSPFISRSARTLSDSGLNSISAKLLPKFSIILSSRAPIGYLAVNKEPMATNQGCKGLIPSAELDYMFLYYFLLANRERLNSLGTGTTFAELSSTALKRFEIPLPPLDEQKRIVAKLDQIRREVGRLSDNVAKQMETVKSLRGAALADRLQGENVLQGNVAAGWPVVMLTDHVEVQPPNGKVKRSDFLARGTYPVVSQEVDSINGWWDGPVEVTPVDRPVVLFGDHTRILKYIDHDFVVGADGVKILRPRSSLDPRFLFHLLTANPPRHLGYARHFRLLKELKFRLPPLEDQKSIAAELDGLGVQFDEIESKLAEQETLLSSFQSAAFSTALAGGP